MLISHYLRTYRAAIEALPDRNKLKKEELLTEDFLMKRDGRISIYYAPHNEYVNPAAQLIIVGLTPGWYQMEKAIVVAKQALKQGLNDEEVCRLAKIEASFAGATRKNLIQMLQELQLEQYLDISSSEDLFHTKRDLLHTVSMLKFPVMIDQSNYSGSQPAILRTPFLKEAALSDMEEELAIIRNALIIPLGKAVEQILTLMVEEGKLDSSRCLWGFPHPSGANAHRFQQFEDRKESMIAQLRLFFTHREE